MKLPRYSRNYRHFVFTLKLYLHIRRFLNNICVSGEISYKMYILYIEYKYASLWHWKKKNVHTFTYETHFIFPTTIRTPAWIADNISRTESVCYLEVLLYKSPWFFKTNLYLQLYISHNKKYSSHPNTLGFKTYRCKLPFCRRKPKNVIALSFRSISTPNMPKTDNQKQLNEYSVIYWVKTTIINRSRTRFIFYFQETCSFSTKTLRW